MVRETLIKDRKLWSCEQCGFSYPDKGTAIECEDFCKKHAACSLEITKKAVRI